MRTLIHCMWTGPCLRMWSTQRSLLCLILRIRLRLQVAVLASAGTLLPLNLANIRLFTPLIRPKICLLSDQVSQPKVRREQTDVSYKGNFKLIPILSESRMWRSWPHLFIALTIRVLTSMIWSASALSIVPRYLKLKTFSRGSSSHMIVGLSFCWSLSFCIWTARSASLPLKHCSFCGLCALDLWILIPLADLHATSRTYMSPSYATATFPRSQFAQGSGVS